MSNAFTVTTGLLIGFAVFVAYTRLKNWLDSNVPIIFYVAILVYTVKFGDLTKLPMWLVLTGFGLGLLLRFEFMSPFFIKVVKVFEAGALAMIIYLSLATILW
jgi:hypothetical protein